MFPVKIEVRLRNAQVDLNLPLVHMSATNFFIVSPDHCNNDLFGPSNTDEPSWILTCQQQQPLYNIHLSTTATSLQQPGLCLTKDDCCRDDAF